MARQTRSVMKRGMAIRALRRDCQLGNGVLHPMCQAQVSCEGCLVQESTRANCASVRSQTRDHKSPDILHSGVSGRCGWGPARKSMMGPKRG
eukprot:11217012-Prorocentrum_lima.AAC.1